jgi:hypothetical protein
MAEEMNAGGASKKFGFMRKLADQRLIIVSAVFALLILGGGAAAFFQLSGIIRSTADQRLVQLLEVERLRLETSVNNEISIAIKMADSPIIRRHFAAPDDSYLNRPKGAIMSISSIRITPMITGTT